MYTDFYCRGWLNALVSGDSVPALAMLVTCYEIVSNNNNNNFELAYMIMCITMHAGDFGTYT